jgi:hypothetical protein
MTISHAITKYFLRASWVSHQPECSCLIGIFTFLVVELRLGKAGHGGTCLQSQHPTPETVRQEDCVLKASQGYIATYSLKKK